MKILLTTLAIGDKYLEQYKKLFYDSQYNYALKHGYEFKVITEYLDPNLKNNDTISFNKILVCNQNWSNHYDLIIFIDADILINKNAPPIHTFIDYGDCIGIIDEFSQPTTEKRIQLQKRMGWEKNASEYYKLCGFDINTSISFNSGVLVLQPKLHNQLLVNIYNKHVLQSINHPRGLHFEQSAIGYEIQKANAFKVLDNKFNAVWGIYKLDNPTTNLQEFFNNNYFIHFAGKLDYDKVPLLK